MTFDRVDEFLNTGRFGDVGKFLREADAPLGRPAPYRTQEQNGYAFEIHVGAEPRGNVAADHAGHDQVKQHEIWLKLEGSVKGLISPILDTDLVIVSLLQVQFEQASKADFVVNKENAFLVHTSLIFQF